MSVRSRRILGCGVVGGRRGRPREYQFYELSSVRRAVRCDEIRYYYGLRVFVELGTVYDVRALARHALGLAARSVWVGANLRR